MTLQDQLIYELVVSENLPNNYEEILTNDLREKINDMRSKVELMKNWFYCSTTSHHCMLLIIKEKNNLLVRCFLKKIENSYVRLYEFIHRMIGEVYVPEIEYIINNLNERELVKICVSIPSLNYKTHFQLLEAILSNNKDLKFGLNVNLLYYYYNRYKREDRNELLLYLLSKNFNLDNDTDEECNTLLLKACIDNDILFAKLFIERNANVNITNIQNESPLMYSCIFDNDLAQLLIDKGAEINIQSTNNKLTPLLNACKANNINLVQLLLHKGANINVKDNQNNTLLHYACETNNIEMVKLVLEAYNSLKNIIPLNMRKTRNRKQLLISNSIPEINLANSDNITPIQYAYKFYNIEMKKLLIYAGAIDYMNI
jgi:ankyrin repeat protein